jgi:hypothetical protein
MGRLESCVMRSAVGGGFGFILVAEGVLVPAWAGTLGWRKFSEALGAGRWRGRRTAMGRWIGNWDGGRVCRCCLLAGVDPRVE